jgi:hypothetical protein
MTRLTDKELIELADKGVLTKDVRNKAIRAYFHSILPVCKFNKDAYLFTANKFGVDMRTVQTVVASK